MNTNTSDSVQAMAEEIFGLTLMTWRERLATRHGEVTELSESQFLTLDQLEKRSPMTVGELQRAIGVLPAQMSRIIRSLESNFDKPLIRCELNQSDKRKIDVALTNPGRKISAEFREARLAKTREVLSGLPDDERQEFVRICRNIKELYKVPTEQKEG